MNGLRSEIAELEQLAAEVSARGLEARLFTPPGRRPYLHVRNPQTALLAEDIYVEAGYYWWSWAERLAAASDTATAATMVARVLRAVDTQR